MAVAVSSVCSVDSAYAQCSGSTPVTMTFKNQNPYPVWLGYNAGAGHNSTAIGTGGEGLQLGNSGQQPDAGLYVEQRCSGSFWARTECHFKDFDADPDYVACNTSADCGSSHVCLGGRCLIDCSTPPRSGTGSVNGTNGNCSGLANSVCVAAARKLRLVHYTIGSYCGFSNGVCATGDCGSGQWQCQGSWDNSSEGSGTLTILDGPAPPVSRVRADRCRHEHYLRREQCCGLQYRCRLYRADRTAHQLRNTRRLVVSVTSIRVVLRCSR